jgi:hypothetical protein
MNNALIMKYINNGSRRLFRIQNIFTDQRNGAQDWFANSNESLSLKVHGQRAL